MAIAETEPQQVGSGSVAIRALDWYQFEKLVALLFTHEGFSVQRFGGARADSGIDLAATKDDITFGVHCKHWKCPPVDGKEVHAFLGALQKQSLRHGFLISLEGFTADAADFANQNGIDLMDEPMLVDNLEAVNWRSHFAFLRLLHDRRKMCPKCESEMVLRTAKEGVQAGQNVWGCSAPRCNYTTSVAQELPSA